MEYQFLAMNFLPNNPSLDGRDKNLRYPIFVCYRRSGASIVENLDNLKGLQFVTFAALSRSVLHIVILSTKKEMGGVAAWGVVALVKNRKTFKDGANKCLVCDTVGSKSSATIAKFSIPLSVHAPRPKPASRIRFRRCALGNPIFEGDLRDNGSSHVTPPIKDHVFRASERHPLLGCSFYFNPIKN